MTENFHKPNPGFQDGEAGFDLPAEYGIIYYHAAGVNREIIL